MTASQLRAALQSLGLSQAAFARLMGVTTRAVALWLSKERAIPGPVEAYLRILFATSDAVRSAELQRLNESEQTMREGLYAVEYYSADTGQSIGGYGVVVFGGGRIYGGDPAGGLYNGEYSFDPKTGLATVTVKLTFPPNGMAVFGVSLPYEWSVEASTTFDARANPGNAVLKTTHGQIVSARFHFIRPIEDAA